jgi:molybdopterin-guanine dinucleotide biosynthesis protein A
MSVTGYVLAGGKSSRFGSDKARAELEGVPLLVRVADVFRLICDDVFAVADVPGKYADLNVPTIADLRPGRGPIAGLETALAHRLQHRGPGWTLLASCDLAGLKVEWTKTVLKHATTLDADSSANAVAFRRDFWQPFPAAFHTDLLPIATKQLDAGIASFQSLLSHSEAMAIALPLPDDWPGIVQVNTPADLEALRDADR